MFKHTSKKLVLAIVALVVSVVVCVGACLAWFALNEKVSGNGLNFELRGDDLVSFNVTAYYLEYDAVTASYTLAESGNHGDILNDVDQNANGIINAEDKMRPYGVGVSYTTAVLFKMDYEFKSDSEKDFRIFCECPTSTRLSVVRTPELGDDDFNSSLSNAIKFENAEKSNSSYALNGQKNTFVDSNYEQCFHVDFYDGINAQNTQDKNEAGNCVGTRFVVMDYDGDRFAYLSSLLLENGGGLSSGLELLGDLLFGIEEYDEQSEVMPISIAVDELAPNYEYAYKQTVGADIISHEWRFVVTYSNGRKRVVSTANSAIEVGTLNTQAVGKHEVDVTFTQGETSVTCQADYIIGVVIGGGTGVAVGESLTLVANGVQDGVGVTWSVENGTGEATINQTSGILSGLAEGTVTVTATVEGYVDEQTTPHLKATTVITITGENVAVTGVTLNKSSLTLKVGEEGALVATVAPENATNKSVTWTSSDTDVATVSGGVVRALAAGSATITVTTAEGGFSATCVVTVRAATVAVTGVTLDKTTATLKLGESESVTLTATVAPENATNKDVTWASSNTAVATVSGGVVTAVAAGEVTITVTTADGSKTATCVVTVEAANAVPEDWLLDFGVKPSEATDYSDGDKLGDYITITSVGYKTKHSDAFLSVNAKNDKNPVFTIEVSAAATLSITWNNDQADRTYTIADSSGNIVDAGSMIKGTATHALSAGTYTITFEGGEHKITEIGLAYTANKKDN